MNQPTQSSLARIGRYIISGLGALATNVGGLFIFVQVFHLWYLLATTLAFIVTVIVSFLLQKFWTFKERSGYRLHTQFAGYILLALVNICVNAALMYLFVSQAGIQYLLAQILSSGTIAVYGFFIYRFLFASAPKTHG